MTENKPNYRILAVLVGLFLLSRLAIVFTGTDNLVYDLETNAGTYTKLMLDGVSPAFLFQHYDNYRWGGLLVAIFCVPFFKFFGPHLVVMRIVMMFFPLGTLVLIYLLLAKFLNRRAAFLACLFFIFMPPGPLRFSLTPMGGYSEINLFFLLASLLFFRVFFDGVPFARDCFFLGAVSGFGLVYDYTFFLVLATLGLSWLAIVRRAVVKKGFYAFLIGFLLGFSPWFYYQVSCGWSALLVMRDKPLISWFGLNGIAGSGAELWRLISVGIPRFFAFRAPDFLRPEWLAYLYYLPAAFAILWLAFQRKKKAVEYYMLTYLAVFLAARALCGITYLSPVEADTVFPERFNVFLIPAFYILCAASLVRMSQMGRAGRIVSAAISSLILCVGIFSVAGMVRIRDPRIALIPAGYNYFSYGKQMRWSQGNDISCIGGLLSRIPPDERRFFYKGFRWGLPVEFNGEKWEERGETFSSVEYFRQLSLIGRKDLPYAVEYLGRALGRMEPGKQFFFRNSENLPDGFSLADFYRGLGSGWSGQELSLNEYKRLLVSVPVELQRSFYYGLGTELDRLLARSPGEFFRFLRIVGPDALKDVYSGFLYGREYSVIGVRELSGSITDSVPSWEGVAKDQGEEFLPGIYQRLGIELGWRILPDLEKARRILNSVAPEHKPRLYRGVGIGIGWRFGENPRLPLLAGALDKDFRSEIMEGIRIGQARRAGAGR